MKAPLLARHQIILTCLDEVKEILEAIWQNPDKDEEIMAEVVARNKEVYEFEKMFEGK